MGDRSAGPASRFHRDEPSEPLSDDRLCLSPAESGRHICEEIQIAHGAHPVRGPPFKASERLG
jgi:hypothetical protein